MLLIFLNLQPFQWHTETSGDGVLDYKISLPYSSFTVPYGGTLVLMQHQNSISKCTFAVSSNFLPTIALIMLSNFKSMMATAE